MKKPRIIYRKLPSGKVQVWWYCIPIAQITWSETCNSWFVGFQNIACNNVECKSKQQCAKEIEEAVQEFLSEAFE